MKWFNKKSDEDLIQLLKNSDGSFKFDPNTVKYRLFASIEMAKQSPHHQTSYAYRFGKYSLMVGSLILLICGTFAFASNAKPGDKLFALNKLGEQVILNLPLSVEQKASVQAYIVSNRLEALDQVQAAADTKKLETVKESDESLTKAIDTITENKKSLEASGDKKSAEKLETVLDKLQLSAQKREATIQNWENQTPEGEIKKEIKKHLAGIKDSRQKAQKEIKRFNKHDQKEQNDKED